MWFAVEAPQTGDALIYAVWGFCGVVVTQLVILVGPIIKAKFESAPASPPPPNGNGNGSALIGLAKDIGQLDERANDNDARDEVQDRELRDQRTVLDEHHMRLSAVEHYLNRRDPDWRNP